MLRMIAAGKAPVDVVGVGEEGIYFDTRGKKFIIGLEPQISDDYQLNCSMEVTKLSGIERGTGHLTLRDLQPKQQFIVEGEEEDEVIVFKPSVTEKVNSISSNTMTLAIPVSGISAISVPYGAIIASINICSEMGPLSSAFDGLSMQSTWGTAVRLPTCTAHTNTQYMQPIPSRTSMWSVEQGAVMNGLGGLNLMGNVPTTEAELLNHSEMVPPAAYSVPLPQSVKFNAANNIRVRVLEAAIPSIFSSLTSSVTDLESTPMKSSPIISTGMKKKPASRPVRHLGPPTGFGFVPSKILESSSALAL